MAPQYEDEYVKARTVLLDALGALGDHRSSAILVGAQAIYIHAGEATFGMAPYTTDADIAINPRSLNKKPPIEQAMKNAGFRHGEQPGIWLGTDNIQVDLLVPESVGGPGRRSARLEGHSKRTARKVDGLEGVLVENQIETISSFRADDDRRFDILVAGPAALLVAKLYKVWERRAEPRRLENKDAADIFRLLQAIPTDKLIAGLAKLRSDPIAATVSANAMDFLQRLFGETEGLGINLLRAAVEGLDDPDVAAASCLELAKDLIQAANDLGL